MLQRIIILVVATALWCGCDEDTYSPTRAFPVTGTWIVQHRTLWDPYGNVEEDYDPADRDQLFLRSIFPGGSLQSLRDDRYIRCLSYDTYEWDCPKLAWYPDSLLDAGGVIHIWDPDINEYDPTVVIGGVIVTSYPSWSSLLWVQDEGFVVERVEAPGGEVVQLVWRQESKLPIDLREHLLRPARANSRTAQNLRPLASAPRWDVAGLYWSSLETGIGSHIAGGNP